MATARNMQTASSKPSHSDTHAPGPQNPTLIINSPCHVDPRIARPHTSSLGTAPFMYPPNRNPPFPRRSRATLCSLTRHRPSDSPGNKPNGELR